MASFQPRFPEIRYAIGRLAVDRSNALGLTRREFVSQLGFQGREAKGHEMLAAFLAGENLSPPFVSHLPNVLEVASSTVDVALRATVQELDAEAGIRALAAEQQYRRTFRPHIRVECARRIPTPICVAALVGVRKLRIIELPPEFGSADEHSRDHITRDTIVRHHREHRGVVPCFGEIEAYFLVLIPGFADEDFGIPFDCRGRRAGSMKTVRRLPNALLGKRHADGRLNALFKNGSVHVTR